MRTIHIVMIAVSTWISTTPVFASLRDQETEIYCHNDLCWLRDISRNCVVRTGNTTYPSVSPQTVLNREDAPRPCDPEDPLSAPSCVIPASIDRIGSQFPMIQIYRLPGDVLAMKIWSWDGKKLFKEASGSDDRIEIKRFNIQHSNGSSWVSVSAECYKIH